jgi:hypothetical protein
MAAEPAVRWHRGVLWVGAAVLMASVAAASALMWAARPATAQRDTAGTADQVHAIVARCTADMVAQTCRVMQGPATSLIPKDTQTVFVAGLGPMSAELYRELRENGQSMCEPLKVACEQDWSGPTCRTARSLYGAASAAQD